MKMGDKIFDYGSMSLLLLLLFCFKVGSVWRVVADLHATSDHEREREGIVKEKTAPLLLKIVGDSFVPTPIIVE